MFDVSTCVSLYIAHFVMLANFFNLTCENKHNLCKVFLYKFQKIYEHYIFLKGKATKTCAFCVEGRKPQKYSNIAMKCDKSIILVNISKLF